MDMQRKVEAELAKWRDRARRQPLLLLGARQVGKTFTATRFGRAYFPSLVTANFQTDLKRLAPVFDAGLDPRRILAGLASVTGERIVPGETLLLFDEVQLSPAALTSLKFFAEQLPEQAIIATGSLFGITIHREPQYALPVGKVDIVRMYPLDFEEFLWATGHRVQADGLRTFVDTRRPFPAHDDALRWVRQYMMTGGLPRVVAAWVEARDWSEVRQLQRDLSTLYVGDMALYAGPSAAIRTREVWDSLPRQLTRETSRKFKLADLKPGARFHQYETSFAWLEAAGLIHRHFEAETPAAPLRPRDGGTFFKAYSLDTGLLAAQVDVIPEVFCDDTRYAQIAPAFRGGIAENYVKQALVAAGLDSLYWTSANTAEIDFLLVDELMRVVPLEVKSGDNVRSQSLRVYKERYSPTRSIRLSTKNIGQDGDLTQLPLYAAYCLPEVLRSGT
ncbi:MAG: ATP-binding protein [Propionibacteriaceae bacterium]|jgi:predicted AAA+ superfamily ATPase|nr:ATP-binding protein [Propionibacteriaceae bacterium]